MTVNGGRETGAATGTGMAAIGTATGDEGIVNVIEKEIEVGGMEIGTRTGSVVAGMGTEERGRREIATGAGVQAARNTRRGERGID